MMGGIWFMHVYIGVVVDFVMKETLMHCPILRSYFGTLLFLDKRDLFGKCMYKSQVGV
jgi:hypothetical protein